MFYTLQWDVTHCKIDFLVYKGLTGIFSELPVKILSQSVQKEHEKNKTRGKLQPCPPSGH